MWRYFLSYCQTFKITNMSNLREKAIEIAKQTSSESAFMCGYDIACQEYEEKLQKAISALKVEIDYPECTLTNSRGDTFTFENNYRNEDLIDFLSSHEEGLKSFL